MGLQESSDAGVGFGNPETAYQRWKRSPTRPYLNEGAMGDRFDPGSFFYLVILVFLLYWFGRALLNVPGIRGVSYREGGQDVSVPHRTFSASSGDSSSVVDGSSARGSGATGAVPAAVGSVLDAADDRIDGCRADWGFPLLLSLMLVASLFLFRLAFKLLWGVDLKVQAVKLWIASVSPNLFGAKKFG